MIIKRVETVVFKNTNAILKLVGALLTEKVDEIFI